MYKTYNESHFHRNMDICFAGIKLCDSYPCMNDATCVDAFDKYTCLCGPAYKGVICEAG